MRKWFMALFLAAGLFVTALPWTSARAEGVVHETTGVETDPGEINNLVSNKQVVNGQTKSVSSNGELVSSSAGIYRDTVYADGGERSCYVLGDKSSVLSTGTQMTVRYSFIGFYYPGRVYIEDETEGIRVGAEVCIDNPINLTRIALFDNFWYGGVISTPSGRPGGRADYHVTFFRTDTGETILLGEDARLMACSLDGWPIEPKVSYEGISFYNAQETWVNYRGNGNITRETGDLFDIPVYFTGERKAAYEDIMDHKTFFNCGVAFRQNGTTWHCAFATQTDHPDGHSDWFYFSTSPENLIRPEEPEKTAEQAVYHVGDEVVYTISQRVASTPEEGYGSYGSFQFVDRLPEGLDYVSAGVTCSSGTMPDSAGVLAYDAGNRTVTYTFSSEYLRSIEYRGQTYTFTVNCRINSAALGGQTFANTAEVAINGEVVTTPAASVTPYYRITTEVVNGVIDPEISGISAGESRSVSFSPSRGYRLESVTVDGIPQDVTLWSDHYRWENISANHHIKVVYTEAVADRSVSLTKRIKADDIVFAHGCPVFLFRLAGTDVLGSERICYQAVIFTPEYVAANTAGDGYVSATVTFSGLMPGVYSASEEETGRYAQEMIAEVSNGTVEAEKVVFDLIAQQTGSAVFTNRKYEQGGYSDSCLVENVVN